jgi:hypothetical protein
MNSLPIIYNQRDPKWAGQRLGTVNGVTIGTDGCYVTSLAMACCYFGYIVTPAELDDIFTDRKLYVSGNLVTDDLLTKITPPAVKLYGVFHYDSTKADLNKLKQLLSDPSLFVVLEVDFDHNAGNGIQTHFLPAVRFEGDRLIVADPWYGVEAPFSDHYGTDPETTILKYVVYQGKPPENLEQKLKDKTDEANENWDCLIMIADKVKISLNPNDKKGSAELICLKYQELQTGLLNCHTDLENANQKLIEKPSTPPDAGTSTPPVEVLPPSQEKQATSTDLLQKIVDLLTKLTKKIGL